MGILVIQMLRIYSWKGLWVDRIKVCPAHIFREDFDQLKGGQVDEKTIEMPLVRRQNCIVIVGKRMGCDDLVLELSSNEQRDELLDGLRNYKSQTSMLFKQNLEKMRKSGYR